MRSNTNKNLGNRSTTTTGVVTDYDDDDIEKSVVDVIEKNSNIDDAEIVYPRSDDSRSRRQPLGSHVSGKMQPMTNEELDYERRMVAAAHTIAPPHQSCTLL